MVNQNLINELDIGEEDVSAELGDIEDFASLGGGLGCEEGAFKPGTILKGRVVSRAGDAVIIDVGLKSEGTVPVREWTESDDTVEVGDEIDVWLESIESDSGTIVLSKRKADRILNWQRIIATKNEGDVVRGRVMRKIKGGLLVDIGVPAFLPASQVDVRRPGDIGEFIGREVECKILKIDTDRRNIVVSRRKMIEEDRAAAREKVMAEIEVGQIRKGLVKNIANFGAFVDLGGIDGLLHITDMSWERINHPADILKVDDEVEIKIVNIDRAKEKIALSLKALKENPWDHLEERCPVGTRLKGEVVNITNYGAFVKLEPGVEGLVHISEMSWTRRIGHPSEILSVGDVVEIVVLDFNKGKQEISLGIKQTEVNPWTRVAEKYPPNTRINGRVRNLTNYGAFVEIEEGIDGLLHVSDMSWTKKVNHPSEIIKKGDEIECVVLKVEEDKQRIALGLRQLHEDPWLQAVPSNYIPGQIVEGTVTKITNFGVFVELEPDLEGLLHVSELADHKVEDPHNEVKMGDRIQVKILRVDPVERKIGLSRKRAVWSAEQEGSAEKSFKARRGGLHGSGEELTDLSKALRSSMTVPVETPPDQPTPQAAPDESPSPDMTDEAVPTDATDEPTPVDVTAETAPVDATDETGTNADTGSSPEAEHQE
ncbi:MAG: 30S ribosomal protein S1 [Planctomycetes bacterium]|nr:30S ribosomal protein S1 [Planctomycetota bacterium]